MTAACHDEVNDVLMFVLKYLAYICCYMFLISPRKLLDSSGLEQEMPLGESPVFATVAKC